MTKTPYYSLIRLQCEGNLLTEEIFPKFFLVRKIIETGIKYRYQRAKLGVKIYLATLSAFKF